ncbi:TB2/DP1, HVA22 family-domain-containing protein [Auriculariales sp. MPI-PUGE-AT-0066]|nr:TB2/DP1, HVA22 family-domain-containing protein [Auriculariales sp. MPI-PUGE-AT-0066]
MSAQTTYDQFLAHPTLSQYPTLNNLEQRTQVPKTFAVLGISGLLVLLLFINALALPVSNMLGFIVPAYLSLQAIETPQTGDDTQWLTYWVVFGAFNFIESLALSVVLHYMPFYFAFKTAFIIYLWLPATRGAQVLYLNAFRPILTNKSRTTTAPTSSAPTYSKPETAQAPVY